MRHMLSARHRILVNHPGDIWQNTYEALCCTFFSNSIIRTTNTSASANSWKRTHYVTMAAIHVLSCTKHSSNSNYVNQGVTPRTYSPVTLYYTFRSIEFYYWHNFHATVSGQVPDFNLGQYFQWWYHEQTLSINPAYISLERGTYEASNYNACLFIDY
jgi:hypothetical protein